MWRGTHPLSYLFFTIGLLMSDFNLQKFEQLIHDKIVEPLVDSLIDKKPDMYRNTLDPFSAMVDCLVRDVSFSEWKEQEVARQSQKTLQNKVGNLHEYVIECFDGWINLPTGSVIDLVNHKDKIIIEVKNKHNTTKGNHKKDIYDDLASELEKHYTGYQAYCVEVLPRNRAEYNKNFTPPDNKTKQSRPSRGDIKVIDGKSFYSLLSGDNDFVNKLYRDYLPTAIKKAMAKINRTRNPDSQIRILTEYESDPFYEELITKTFK